MNKAAAGVIAATLLTLTMAGTALADYTEAPSATGVVEGSGGTASEAGAGDAAFTGGSVSTALVVVVVLLAVGGVALLLARRRTATP